MNEAALFALVASLRRTTLSAGAALDALEGYEELAEAVRRNRVEALTTAQVAFYKDVSRAFEWFEMINHRPPNTEEAIRIAASVRAPL